MSGRGLPHVRHASTRITNRRAACASWPVSRAHSRRKCPLAQRPDRAATKVEKAKRGLPRDPSLARPLPGLTVARPEPAPAGRSDCAHGRSAGLSFPLHFHRRAELPEDAVVVMDEEAGGLTPGGCFEGLLLHPGERWVGRDVHMDRGRIEP
jgi:hypothetical protein